MSDAMELLSQCL